MSSATILTSACGSVRSSAFFAATLALAVALPMVAVADTAYKPSININFTDSGNSLTTADDVGLSGYEVPGTSWNNFAAANATYSTVNAVDSTGTASVMSGVSVTVSGTRGSYSCSGLTSASNPLHGYIDEAADNMTPTVTVTGIPYYKYRVIVYHSTDTANVPFGYDTINGTSYTYVNDALAEGTTAWGSSGADKSANAIAEGGNVLLTGELSGSALTVVGHRAGGSSNARGCIAAIQIIEVRPEIGENDLEIPVSGDTTYTVSEAKTLSGTVYVTGIGTLTLDGSAKISAATIDVGSSVVLNVNADRLDGATYKGAGTVVYDGVKPTTGKGWTVSTAWTGTVWVKNIPTSSNERKDWDPALYGNADSTLRFTNVNLFFQSGTGTSFPGTVDLDDTGLNICDGYGGSIATIARLTGSGTLSTTGGSSDGNGLTVNDASAFTGTITLTKYKVIIGTATGTSASGVLHVEGGKSITVSGATAPGGFVVNGTLNANGTLASSQETRAIQGAGTVVFTGRAPTPTGDAWWKNEAWTGTVTVKSVTNLIGTSGSGTYIDFNECGNAGSVIELDTVSGWINPGYVCTVPLKVTGTLSLNNGYSNKANAFKVGTLLGSGSISGSGSAGQVVFNVTTDWSGFTGTIGLNNKCVVFGKTIPDTITEGQIYVSEGAVVTNNVASGLWWAEGGIKVDGELCAPGLGKFGDGTTITTGDSGVFTLVTNSNVDDMNTDYSRITGTGTLRLEGTGYRSISTNNFPTAMTVDNRLTTGFLHRIPGLEITIGSLAGDGYLRSDWGGSAGDRDLKVLQAKDTTWGGKFWTSNPHRFRSLIVAPGATASGTLTISATHESAESTGLTVESGAAVNLTGTWVGATTVAGTFGGTGTVTGDVTLSDGATIEVNDISQPLTITGDFSASGAIEIRLPAGTSIGTVVDVISIGGEIDSSATFAVYVGDNLARARVSAKNGKLSISRLLFAITLR